VVGPDGLSRFEELSRREAARTAILYAFDLIELGGEDMRNRPFLDHKAAQLLRHTQAGILFNEHIVQDGPVVFAHACRLGAEGIVSKKVDGTYRSGPCRVWIKVRNPASIARAAGAKRDLEPISAALFVPAIGRGLKPREQLLLLSSRPILPAWP
jgi:ATP-dependent DNA ligase